MDELVPQLNPEIEELQHLIKLRRKFHQYPEIGFTEYWTTCNICEYLDQLGYNLNYGKKLYKNAYPNIDHISEIANVDINKINEAYELTKDKLNDDKWLKDMNGGFTGVIAGLKCSDEGPNIGFRFDIDGLAIKESSENSHFPKAENFESKNENMHACGHDGHITIGLGLAKNIIENKHNLSANFFLIFQPSEEIASGGEVFSKFDIFRKLDYLIPIHIGILDERKIVCSVSFLALKCLKITFKGKNTHASAYPERGKNALLAACAAVNNLYGISRHSEGISRINIGNFF